MKLALVAALLIGLPAVAVVLVFWGSPVAIPALASLSVAAIPCLGFAFYLRGARNVEDGGDGH